MKVKKYQKVLLFILVLLIGFILRAILTTVINKGDVLAINEWSKSLYLDGLKGSYFREGWIYTFPTQPPLMMLLYWLSRWLYENKYILSMSHNLIKLPPAFILTWIHENGPLFSVRLWGILGDLIGSGVVYLILTKVFKRPKLAILSLILLLFNPLLIFDSSIWGQTDILSSLFALLAFLSIYNRIARTPDFSPGGEGKARFQASPGVNSKAVESLQRKTLGFQPREAYKKKLIIFSPIFFSLGIFFKPTILLIFPIYIFVVIKELLHSFKKEKTLICTFMIGVLLSITIAVSTAIPFYDQKGSFTEFLDTVLIRRVVPSAKGISKVSTSALTFYTIFYDIDKTLGAKKILFLTLDQVGNISFLVINSIGFAILLKKRKELKEELTNLFFVVYLVVQGTFLFKTNMAERYFFPSFFFLWTLLFIVKDKKIKLLLIFQNILWFVNLYSSFYLSDYHYLDVFFRQNNYFGTRLFSLLNVVVFFCIIQNYIKNINSTTKVT